MSLLPQTPALACDLPNLAATAAVTRDRNRPLEPITWFDDCLIAAGLARRSFMLRLRRRAKSHKVTRRRQNELISVETMRSACCQPPQSRSLYTPVFLLETMNAS